jgi:hypothetical protein
LRPPSITFSSRVSYGAQTAYARMVGRLPFVVTVVSTAVAVQPVGVPACGFGADFETAAFPLAPCVMMAPPLIGFGVAPEQVAVDAVDSTHCIVATERTSRSGGHHGRRSDRAGSTGGTSCFGGTSRTLRSLRTLSAGSTRTARFDCGLVRLWLVCCSWTQFGSSGQNVAFASR